MTFKKVGTLAILILFGLAVFAQNKIKSPDEFLPFKLGNHFTPHHLLVDYFEHIADNSNQVVLEEYGRTNELRPLIYAVVSTPENLKRIESIRLNNLKRTGLIDGEPDREDIAIVWLSFNVHGNEAGGAESSMPIIYDLVNPKNERTKKWLENTIVIIDPCINPDGYSRYTNWNWQVGNISPNANPISIEHNEPWPGGRVNHYLFDLNRDWAWQTQVETKQRLDIYNKWMPHIHVDYHEMGHNEPYYFAPAAQPYHDRITNWQAEFQTNVGKNNATYFDQEGWLYFTREVFDLFYPSYGDTYPIFNGAIGMTYEQAGHGKAGRAIQLENGDTLSLMDRIMHHRSTALSTIEVSSNNAQKLVKEFADYFKINENDLKGDYQTYIIKENNNPTQIQALCKLLDKHKIRYGRAGKESKVTDAFNYISGKTTTVNMEANDLVISIHQPKSVLTQVLFEPEPFLNDSLTYDITAWALPYAYGLESFAVKEKLKPNKSYELPKYIAQKYKSEKNYAYLASWNGVPDAQFLKTLLEQKISVRVAREPFKIANEFYPVGTLLINRGDNRRHGNRFDEIVRKVAAKTEKKIIPLQSGLATSGGDLGSDKMTLLEEPKILVINGEATNVNEFGQVWYFFDQVLGQEITIVGMEALSKIDLRAFNTLVLPEGDYDEVSDQAFGNLSGWVEKGGKLIAIGSAVSFFKDKRGFGLRKNNENKNSDSKKLKAPLKVYEGQERKSISNAMPGAIYKLRFDNSHPLGYGFPSHYFSLKTNKQIVPYLKNAWNVGYIDGNPKSIGFVGKDIKKKMKETTVFGVQSIKKGKIIYMVDNPLFRGFWEQGKFLFCNAVYIVN